ncbi:hypothetical protein FJZ36_07145 [Candidatus Poribacteria bacterium]|nr:hypothetical protein [Candidatus Poribacteria bacterium]
MSRTIAIQIGAVSFQDEGIESTLDILEARGAVNALFLASPTWTRGTGGRQVPGHPLPDHGVQEYDHDWVGGNYATVHEQYYRTTALGAAGRAAEHGDWDLFEAVIPAARKRGMKSYAWMEESYYAHVRNMPSFVQVAEIDAQGRRTGNSCMNHPDYRAWWLSIVEDYCRHYELDGLAFCSERTGPLATVLSGGGGGGGCFCDHCRQLARERGVDVERARRGVRALSELFRRDGIPSDGAFVAAWRVLLDHPDVLGWERHWAESQRSLYREIYGGAKAIKHGVQVGWHIHHANSFNPFYRATQDYGDLAGYSDFIKVVMYHNCAGPRFQGYVNGISKALLADSGAESNYAWLCAVLGYDDTQPPFGDIAQVRFNAEYVRRETLRALAGVRERCDIWPGIDIDIPTGPNDARCTPDGTGAAVRAALEAGAQGVVLSRKYSEMYLTNLDGAGAAVRSA